MIVQVESRACDLIEAGQVALQAVGEKEAAAAMQHGGDGRGGVRESIDLEVTKAERLHRLSFLV